MADTVRVNARGFNAAVRKLRAMGKASKAAAPSGARMVGEVIMTDVKISRPGAGVPRDTGVLAASGRVTGGTPSKPVVRLTFGGAAAPYALRQHEDMSLSHNLGEARYLVRGLERFEPGQAERAMKEMADAVVAAGKAG